MLTYFQQEINFHCFKIKTAMEMKSTPECQQCVNVKTLMSMLDTEALSKLSENTNVDHHARKLKGLTLLKLFLQGVFLFGPRLSLSAMKMYYSSKYFVSSASLIEGARISKAAISKRLKSINADYFREIYESAVNTWGPILEKQQRNVIDGLEIKAVDSSIVPQTARILAEGIHAGGPDGSAGGRKGVKYTMVYDGVGCEFAEAHIKARYADEDNALGEALMAVAKKDPVTRKESLYVFDRGVKGGDLIGKFVREGLRFVGRFNDRRKFADPSPSGAPEGDLPDNATLVFDNKVRIYGKDRNIPLPYQLRVIKVDLGIELGKRKYDKPKKADTAIVLITDEMELPAADILEIYRRRWTIELFFKFLKQNLDFSHLMSGSENGLTVLLYMTLIGAILLKTYCILNNCIPKTATTKIWLELGEDIMQYIDSTSKNSYSSPELNSM